MVSTIRPPKITIMIMIGSSQNFLRSRMKAQSSTIMEPMDRSFRNQNWFFIDCGGGPGGLRSIQ